MYCSVFSSSNSCCPPLAWCDYSREVLAWKLGLLAKNCLLLVLLVGRTCSLYRMIKIEVWTFFQPPELDFIIVLSTIVEILHWMHRCTLICTFWKAVDLTCCFTAHDKILWQFCAVQLWYGQLCALWVESFIGGLYLSFWGYMKKISYYIKPYDNGTWELIQYNQYRNPTMEIRQCYDCLISPMGFPVLVRRHLYIKSGPILYLSYTCHYHCCPCQ